MLPPQSELGNSDVLRSLPLTFLVSKSWSHSVLADGLPLPCGEDKILGNSRPGVFWSRYPNRMRIIFLTVSSYLSDERSLIDPD